jgi:hypothetical protein
LESIGMADQSTTVLHQNVNNNYSAPLGSLTSGRLLFASGAAGITIQGDPNLSDLYRAHFERPMPSIQVQEGIVTFRYRHRSFLEWLTNWREPLAHLTLNGSIPWEIEFRGGVAKLTADLRALSLRALDLGSASEIKLILPSPSGTVYIYIAGSASDVTIQHPPGSALRVQIGGGASNLTFDEQRFGAVADGICWQTPDYNGAVNRYEISIAGSVSNMTIGLRDT